MTAAVFALILVAEVDANALLQRVAANYAALKSFSLEVRQNQQAGPGGGSVLRGTTRIGLDAGAGNRYCYRETRDNAMSLDSLPALTIVSDGQAIWRIDGRQPGPVQEEPGLYSDRLVREAIHALHRRFAMLDGPAMRARYVKSEKVRGKQCAVVEIENRLSEAPEQWKERLWIDPESATILRSVFTNNSNQSGQQSVTQREYDVPPGQRQPDESRFRVKPAPRPRP